MKTMCRMVVGAMAIFVLASGVMAGDWPQWRGADRDGINKEKGLLSDWTQTPKQLWLVTTPGAGYAAPSVAGGVVYVTGSSGSGKAHTGTLFALNAKDGSVKWTCEYGPEWNSNYDLARTTPTVADDRVYLISGMNNVICVDAKNGKIAWSVNLLERFKGRNIGWGIAESPLLVGKTIICHPGGPDAAVAALDCETGATVWTTKGLSDASAYCSPALLTLGGKKQIVTQTADNVVGIDPENGAVLWKHPHRNKYAVHPNTPVAVAPDMVVVSSGYGYGAEGLQISASGVKQVWKNKEQDDHFHGMVLVGKRLYLTPSSGPLLCVNPETGVVLARAEGVGRASIIATEAGIVGYDEKKGQVTLVKLDGDQMQVAGSIPVKFGSQQHWSSPVIANGVLYIRHGDALAAYDLKAGQ